MAKPSESRVVVVESLLESPTGPDELDRLERYTLSLRTELVQNSGLLVRSLRGKCVQEYL